MPAELAKQILQSGSFDPAPSSRGAEDLIALTRKRPGAEAWYAAVSDADLPAVIAAMGQLSAAHPDFGLLQHAHRDAARASVEQRLTEQMIEKMDRLERQAARLQKAAIAVAVVLGLATLAVGIL